MKLTPFISLSLDKDAGGSFGGNAGTMTAPEFQKTAAGIIEGTAKRVQENAQTFDTYQKETKQAFEELTKAQRKAADDIQGVTLALEKCRLQLSREKRLATGDVYQRALADDEVRCLVNALVRTALNKGGANCILNSDQKSVLEKHQKALGEGSSPGSTLIQSVILPVIYDTLSTYGIWGTLAVEPLSTLTTNMPVDTADPVASFVDEAAAISDDTNITGSTVVASVKKIGVLLKVSRELERDSVFDIAAFVLKKMARAIAKRMDYAAFVADGTADATNGGYTGAFNFGTAAVAASGHTTVESMAFEDITAVTLSTDEQIMLRNAQWWMHPFILTRLLSIKDLNGRPIFLNALEAPAPGKLGSILGRPVNIGNICPKVNSANKAVALYGDPEGFVVGLRQDVEFDRSEHAFFPNDQIGFRGICRAAFKGRIATALAVLKTAAS